MKPPYGGITWWRHQMETFSALLAFCVGNSPVTGEFPSQRQWREALMFSQICAWINGWVNNGDWRRHRAHYDVIVMLTHHLNQCCLIVNWAIRKKFGELNKKTSIFIQENAFQYVVCRMASGLSRLRDALNEADTTVAFRCGCETIHWRHNGCDGISNHQPHDCLLNRLFKCRTKKTSKLRVTGLSAGNSPVTGEFPAQMASNAENVSIWWRHHEFFLRLGVVGCLQCHTVLPDFTSGHENVFLINRPFAKGIYPPTTQITINASFDIVTVTPHKIAVNKEWTFGWSETPWLPCDAT